MKKHFCPHPEVGALIDVERQLRIQEQKGYGIKDFSRAAHLSTRTYRK